MELRLNLYPGHIDVLEVTQTEKELANEVIKRIGTNNLYVRDGKVVRWVENPHYDCFAEHTHDSPGRYKVVSESAEDIELLKAVNLVVRALEGRKKILDTGSSAKVK